MERLRFAVQHVVRWRAVVNDRQFQYRRRPLPCTREGSHSIAKRNDPQGWTDAGHRLAVNSSSILLPGHAWVLCKHPRLTPCPRLTYRLQTAHLTASVSSSTLPPRFPRVTARSPPTSFA